MKYTTPASRAPGVSSLGMIRAVIASISFASCGLKNANFGGAVDCAALCAWSAAASRADQCVEIQTAESPVAPCSKKRLRLSEESIVANLEKGDLANVSRRTSTVKGYLGGAQLIHSQNGFANTLQCQTCG